MAFDGIFPAPLLEPARYGLLDAANVIRYQADGETHWYSKADVETEACYFNSEVYDVCDPSKRATILSATSDARSRIIYPFGITASDTCSTFGFRSMETRKRRAMRQLEAITPKAVEREFWNGALAVAAGHADTGENTFLGDPAHATTITSGAIPVKRAIALLEGSLASCGAGVRGMIHLPRSVASMADTFLQTEDVQLEVENEPHKRLVTKLGTVVAAGVGYPGTQPSLTPAAVTPSSIWIYGTGLVTVHLSPAEPLGEQPGQSVRISDNTIKTYAERVAAVVWDGCCHFAAQVDLTAS